MKLTMPNPKLINLSIFFVKRMYWKFRYRYFTSNMKKGQLFFSSHYKHSNPIFNSSAEVLHLVPLSVIMDGLIFHGSTKDIRNKHEYFQRSHVKYHTLLCPRRQDLLLGMLKWYHWKFRDFSTYKLIILDIPGEWSKVVRLIKRLSPRTQVVFRSHNAEFFHRLDWLRSVRGPLSAFRIMKQVLRGLIGDYLMVRSADFILPICTWDTHHYWLKLCRGDETLIRKIYNIPYFYPTNLDEYALPKTFPKKENSIVCLGMAGKSSLLIEQNLKNFSDTVSALPETTRKQWKFFYTGITPNSFKMTDAVKPLGELASPLDALAKSRAMVIMSDLGRGFKTKILEAILCKCFVILPETLYRRLPIEVMPFCIPFTDHKPESFLVCLTSAEKSFPDFPVNDLLKMMAYRGLDEILHATKISETRQHLKPPNSLKAEATSSSESSSMVAPF